MTAWEYYPHSLFSTGRPWDASQKVMFIPRWAILKVRDGPEANKSRRLEAETSILFTNVA